MIRIIISHLSISRSVHHRYLDIDQCVHIPKGWGLLKGDNVQVCKINPVRKNFDLTPSRWIGAGVRSSSLLTVLFLTASVLWLFSCPHTFGCLLLSVLQQVEVKCYLSGIQCIPSLCPTLCLSLSLSLSLYCSLYLDGACLLCFITLSSIFQRHSHTFITKLHLIRDDLPRLFLAH